MQHIKMTTEREYPVFIAPEEMDDYLNKGWYRMGQAIFTCHFLWFGEKLYSAIWLRLSLRDFQFSKKQRKLLRRNEQRFSYIIRPAKLTYSKDRLYSRYRQQFNGRLAYTLRESLQDGSDKNIYNTQEICIYEGNRLVAFSFFDIGKTSIASILGIYDPDYHSFSLGYYTMLLEIIYGLNHGFHYYFPGYVVPGYDRFEYKKRIGAVQYYNPIQQNWLPYDKKTPPPTPLAQMESKLDQLQDELVRAGISIKKCQYPLFEANLFGFWKANYLEYPIFLWCFPQSFNLDYLVLTYDLVKNQYYLLRCSQFDDLPFYIKEWSESHDLLESKFTELLIVEEIIVKTNSISLIIQQLYNQK